MCFYAIAGGVHGYVPPRRPEEINVQGISVLVQMLPELLSEVGNGLSLAPNIFGNDTELCLIAVGTNASH